MINGLNPCGCWVESIRHEYCGSIRPYIDDPTREVNVRWYFTAKNAAQFPYPTIFGDAIYSPRTFKPALGMTYDWHPGYWPTCPQAGGEVPCGNADAWRNGVLTTAPPCVCVRDDVGPIQEIPTGLIDGVNRVFKLTKAPISNAGLLIVLNGLVQTRTVDYNVSTQTITFVAGSQPRVGNNLLAMYWSC